MHHKNAELQAVQKKLDNLTDQIAHQTDRLIVEQKQSIQLEVDDLLGEVKLLEESKNKNQGLLDAITVDVEQKNQQLQEANVTLQNITNNVALGKNQLETFEDMVVELQKQIHNLKNDQLAVEKVVSGLESSKNTLQTDIVTLESDKQAILVSLEQLQTEYDDNVSDKDNKIQLLDSKILKKTQELEALHANESTIRNDLAIWERGLQERDKNLRIRESKVAVGEDKLVQNSNLLSL